MKVKKRNAMVIKAVIWDLGGVIVRTEDLAPRDALAEHLGLSRQEIDHIVFEADERNSAQLGEIDGEAYSQATADRLGLNLQEFRQEFFGGDRLDEELVAHIRELRPKYKMALLSNALSNLRTFLADWNITDAFDLIVVSAEEHLLKPDPAIYKLALDRLGVNAAEAVFIDDIEANVEGARRVGMQGIQFISREQALGDLHALLDHK
ncbi:MAG: HAD family phosphatase [Chloroflexi bacterium]|nr:HAD family phosphatase [Chloroflexota bacterium]